MNTLVTSGFNSNETNETVSLLVQALSPEVFALTPPSERHLLLEYELLGPHPAAGLMQIS